MLGREEKMRVIITGGTGLIGRALAADLAGDGREMIVSQGEFCSTAQLAKKQVLWYNYERDVGVTEAVTVFASCKSAG
jgi:NAD(P)-dependent dehydrogenase (short-subunit alcohol dehydrogenase family)